MAEIGSKPRKIATVEELRELVGQELGSSPWEMVTQEKVEQFAEVSGDYQWIHTDVERARAESPYGQTVAHGFLTLSLLYAMSRQAMDLDLGATMRVNYGFNRVRFTAPVMVGSRVRGVFDLTEIREFDGGVDVTFGVRVEAENESRPRLVAEWIIRAYC